MYAQLLIAASFAVAAYQDIKERAVSDLVWVPAFVGAGYAMFFLFSDSPLFEYQLVRLGLVGAIAFAFTYFGLVGQADAIALAFVASDPYSFSPIAPLFAGAAVALAHIGYEYAVGNAKGGKTIPIEQFLREQRWIPKAVVSESKRTEVTGDVNVARDEVEAAQTPGMTVEVGYGVPTVAYLGIGYMAFVVFLALFDRGTLLSLA